MPYAVFSDALLPVLRAVEPSVLTLLTRGGTAELTQLFPALDDGRGAASAAPRGDPAELKARLLWNFSQFLSRFAAKRPLLIVLENLQWADSASLEMLHFVARQIGGDRDRADRHAQRSRSSRTSASLRATEQSLAEFGNAQRLRLAPLSVDAITELLERMFGAEPRERGVRRTTAALDRRQSVLHRRDDQGARRSGAASRDRPAAGSGGTSTSCAFRRRFARRCSRASPSCRRTRDDWPTSPPCSARAARTTSSRR